MSNLTILAISGSLRAASINGALCHAAAAFAPSDVAVEIYTGLGRLPHYDADLDVEMPPEAVADLRDRITAADGLLVATPEYNGSVPGVLKNALDWASTPHGASALTGKPVAVAGATPGRSGTAGAQAHLRQVLARIGSELVDGPEVAISKAYDVFDEHSRLTDELIAASVAGLLDALRHSVLRAEPANAAA